MQEVIFCRCGRVIENNRCKKHGKDWLTLKEWKDGTRTRIGKYSGPTKRMKGAYEHN